MQYTYDVFVFIQFEMKLHLIVSCLNVDYECCVGVSTPPTSNDYSIDMRNHKNIIHSSDYEAKKSTTNSMNCQNKKRN